MIKGNNLIISANGLVLAASKSCSVERSVNLIEVSSAANGNWKHSIPGRNEWRLETNHLIPNVMEQYPLVKVNSKGWSDLNGNATVSFMGVTKTFSTKGLYVVRFHYTSGSWMATDTRYNTEDSDTAISNFVSDCAQGFSASTGDVIAICSVDSFKLTAAMRTAIATYIKVPTIQIPSSMTGIGSLAIIGCIDTGGQGICVAASGYDGKAHAMAYYIDDMVKTLDTPIKKFFNRVGQVYTIQVLLDGYGSDYLTGQAICKNAKIAGTMGTILNGSFSFEGTGPLQ